MADFFDQICKVIAETGTKSPGILGDPADVQAFFSEIKPEVLPPDPAAAAADPVITPAGNDPMETLRQSIQGCCRCNLHRTRKNIVFGEGDPQAKLMFIGEAPGFDEDRSGRPFVGKAGQLLDKMISAMQFSRDEVFIANIVKCRPPENRAPAPEEADCCISYLQQQINIVRPEVIVLLGAVAVKYLLNTTTGISKMRGKWTSYENIPVMPTFHPAFLLRQESAKREAWQDLQQVMARFGKFHKK